MVQYVDKDRYKYKSQSQSRSKSLFFIICFAFIFYDRAASANCFNNMCKEQGHDDFNSDMNINSKNIKLQDFGKRGHVFNIKEESLLELIRNKLNIAKESGKIKELQEAFKKKAIKKIKRPNQVQGISRTIEPRIFYFDPTYVQEFDVRDHLGNIIVKSGTTINPLTHFSWGEPLIFIDGDEVSQVIWAKSQKGKIILVKGAPLELQEIHKEWFYFDQAGILTEKFGIRQVPAIVEQEWLKLKISEIKL